jgi:putative glutamine amidotransferase
MPLPIIGLTTRRGKLDVHFRAYLDAVTRAGGKPELIPYGLSQEARRALFGRLDGILFTGGGDIAPARFGAELHPSIHNVDEERDELEFSFLQSAVEMGKPFLGICRGCQVVNVGLGGTLYTDIESQKEGAIRHKYSSQTQREYLAHVVHVEAGSHLAKILGEAELRVNSLHHQGAKEIPTRLKPVAYAPDGLVEAMELAEHPFGIAIQWHPECLTDQPSTRQLFQTFVEAAGKRHKK